MYWRTVGALTERPVRYLFLACMLLLAVGAAPALADCTDNDGDGYGSPGDAACPNGPAEDCDDGDDTVFPGGTQICGDDVDNDCDATDESDIALFHVGIACEYGDPPPCMAGDPGGCCISLGITVCADMFSSECIPDPPPPPELQETEGPGGDPSCFDGDDNDCDGVVDHAEGDCQTAELCNGFDDDNVNGVDDTFPTLGDPCTVGVGACEDTGVEICSGDGLGTVCDAEPGTPGGESNPAKCSDGTDNDCDGLTDLDDPDCQSAEVCDGVDNDGNDGVDEDFPTLGDPCSVGTGACEVFGMEVCSGDQLSTECDVLPDPPSAEGPVGPTCTDTIDNDCDGLADMDDPDCDSSLMSVTCELDRGQPGSDCTGWFRIFIETSGHSEDAELVAELLALDEDGTILDSIDVLSGRLAHLASRKNNLKVNAKDVTYEMFAPIPLLRVTLDDGLNRKQAYCSNIPYLEVVEPQGGVVSETLGNVTQVLAAIPIVDPTSLFLKVDGVDVFAEMVPPINPATDFPGGPYDGNVTIGGEMVHVGDVVVDTAPPGEQASNTLSLHLEGLGCGGHIFVVDGDVLPEGRPDPITRQCVVDDLHDKGNSIVFEFDITSPLPGEVVAAVPTPVTGEVCHGLEIAETSINGKDLPTAGQIFTPGDGEDSGDKYVLPINTTLPQTDLALDLATGAAPLGTFDEGTNRLIADASDVDGNRVFETFFFATGNVAPLNAAGGPTPEGILAALGDGIVAGFDPDGVQNFFSGLCGQAGPGLNLALLTLPSSIAPISIPVPDIGFGVCNPGPVTAVVTAVDFNPAYDWGSACTTTLNDGFIHVDAALPNVTANVDLDGYCKNNLEIDLGFLGTITVCFSEIIIDTTVDVPLNGMSISFDVTEEQLEMGGAIMPTLNPPPGPINPVLTGPEPEVNCIAGFVLDVINAISSVLEFFGFTDGPLLPTLAEELADTDISDQLNLSGLPNIPLPDLSFSQDIEAFMVSLTASLEDVEINANGMTASFDSEFAPTMLAPEIPETPGFVETPDPTVTLPVGAADNTFIVLSDDLLNQLFASLTASGKLQTAFESSGITVLDVFPTIDDPANALIKLALNSKNIFSDTALILSARGEVPPRTLIQDNGGTPVIEVAVRVNDLSTTLVADRNGTGAVEGDLDSLPDCLAPFAPTIGDCAIFEACLDLNILADLDLVMIGDNPAITVDITSLLAGDLETGVVCGSPFGGDDDSLIDEATASAAINSYLSTVDVSVPPFEAVGLDLGGVVMFDSPRLIAIETDGDPTFDEYLGITGNTIPAP